MAAENQTPPAAFSIPGLSLVTGQEASETSAPQEETPSPAPQSSPSPPLVAASINPAPTTHASGWAPINEDAASHPSGRNPINRRTSELNPGSQLVNVLNSQPSDGKQTLEKPESHQVAFGTPPAPVTEEPTPAKPKHKKAKFSVPVGSASAPVNQIHDETPSGSEADEPTTSTPANAPKSKSAKLFSDYKAAQAAAALLPVPAYTEGCGWGTYPMPPEGESPKPHTNSPPAINTNGQTNPALWEDRRSRFEKNGIDQSDKLPLKLIDMRVDPKTKKPKRQPMYWTWGAPLDYNDNKTIKDINDRRKTNIERICRDPPWTEYERKILALLFEMYPEISMKEAAERWNYHFVNNFTGDGYVGRADPNDPRETHFGEPDNFRRCPRTLESIRAEYLENQDSYNQGEAPKIKKRPNDNGKGKKRKIEMYCSDQEEKGDDKPKVKRAKKESTPAPPKPEEKEAPAPESAFFPEVRLLIKKHIQAQLRQKAAKSKAESGKITQRARLLNWQEIMRALNDERKSGLSAAEKKKYRNVKYQDLKEEHDKFKQQYRDAEFDITGDLVMKDADDEDKPQEDTTHTEEASQQGSDEPIPASSAPSPTSSVLNARFLDLAGVSESDFPPSASPPRRTHPSPPRPQTPTPHIELDYSISFHHAERCILSDLNDENTYAYEHPSKLADALNKRRRVEHPELKQKNRTRAQVERHWEFFGGMYQKGEVPGEEYDGWMPETEGAETAETHVSSVLTVQDTESAQIESGVGETETHTPVVVDTVQQTTTTTTTTTVAATVDTGSELSLEVRNRVFRRTQQIAREAGATGTQVFRAGLDAWGRALHEVRAEIAAEAEAKAAAEQETAATLTEGAISTRQMEDYVEDEVDWSDGEDRGGESGGEVDVAVSTSAPVQVSDEEDEEEL
ncbi:uncharacterized protein BDZ99DRAFT_568913 [Mytilinidion resinicola]|uniref:Uncharacterized protein n=1 Tax=Mytilinidion resinicola TaxID=574789 RepID=A0A6A6YTA0_9PEZI|nr:uncharacterized protein BDZ99DRAFT_568913 [Mytilinidion resinicola]KAF2812176.1 hypothetical protein BDZ99DRAFT_568913 [Mytilinidion resinicola]